jgi:hypothetical protein
MVVVVKDEKVFERGDSWDKITPNAAVVQGNGFHNFPQVACIHRRFGGVLHANAASTKSWCGGG